jgi:UDP-3-O-acyl-N-acetylglucosamine deacetylase
MSANEQQHGGSHYKELKIQPWDFIDANEIPFLEGCAIKYLTRWRDKGGVEDLKKAIHFIEKRIELEETKGKELPEPVDDIPF